MRIFDTLIFTHNCVFEEGQQVLKEAQWMADKFARDIGYKKHPGWERDTHSLSDPEFNSNIVRQYRAYKVKDKIDECVNSYTKQLGHTEQTISGWEITSSWLTNTAPGEYARLHHHGTADISGVLYVRSDPNTSGNLYLQNHDPVKSSTPLMRLQNNQIDLSPGEGILILFPGWMLHGTRINQSTTDRISLSFNIKLNSNLE
jgi:uncharacterized protein (TIGR02466 family)